LHIGYLKLKNSLKNKFFIGIPLLNLSK
jgi:hypothetical protein